ncbi:MAG: Crp/Fnr family transcriptional regulator [Gammaproteobacteria bacterium]|jgi:CRP/FNR family transcriptional regulator|nr:Crp/Fnr family transcriptional regulator [Gammaproteobacteria bacterium]
MKKSDKFVVSCQQCGLNALCIPYSLTHEEMDEVDGVVKRGKPLQRGENLFTTGTTFNSFYAIRSGAIKSYNIDENGEEHVIGFSLPGEILGLDAIDTAKHVSSAKALETTSICEIPYSQVETLSSKIHNLQAHMYRLLSREIREDQELQMLLGKKTAEEKIGTFLLNLSLRYEQRKLSSTLFRLPMARTDIGNYLGLAVETVSRVFTRLQCNGGIKVEGKEVEILDRRYLCEIAHSALPNP